MRVRYLHTNPGDAWIVACPLASSGSFKLRNFLSELHATMSASLGNSTAWPKPVVPVGSIPPNAVLKQYPVWGATPARVANSTWLSQFPEEATPNPSMYTTRQIAAEMYGKSEHIANQLKTVEGKWYIACQRPSDCFPHQVNNARLHCYKTSLDHPTFGEGADWGGGGRRLADVFSATKTELTCQCDHVSWRERAEELSAVFGVTHASTERVCGIMYLSPRCSTFACGQPRGQNRRRAS